MIVSQTRTRSDFRTGMNLWGVVEASLSRIYQMDKYIGFRCGLECGHRSDLQNPKKLTF